MISLRVSAYLSLICFAAACSAYGVDEPGTDDPLQEFTDFPDSLFGGIYLNQSLADARYSLLQNGFDVIDSSGSFNYRRTTDSTEVILPDEVNIHRLKILLHSSAIMARKQQLLSGFSLQATTIEQSPQFSVFEYQLGHVDFKLTVFIQEDFIRLNFEQQISK